MKMFLRANSLKCIAVFAMWLFFFFGVAGNVLADEATGLELVSCAPSIVFGKENTFNMKKDEAVAFVCEIKNNGTEKISALLLGKEIKEEGIEAEKNSISSSSVELTGAEHREVKLIFPAFSEDGDYHFTFSLKDVVTGNSVSKELNYLGVLGGAADDAVEIKKNDIVNNDVVDSEPTTQDQKPEEPKTHKVLFWSLGGALVLVFVEIFARYKKRKTKRRMGIKHNLLEYETIRKQKIHDYKKHN